VNGRVMNNRGGVIANAEISLLNLPSAAPMANMPNMRAGSMPVTTGNSGADGAFSLTQVPAGQYVLQVDAPGFERSSQQITVPSSQAIAVTLEALELPGAESVTTSLAASDNQALLARVAALEKRLAELESTTVLSEPETRVKKIETYVDKNSNQYDQPTPGAKKVVQYQRERVYRRQNIAGKIEEALSGEKEKSVQVGVSAATAVQAAVQTRGPAQFADGHAYELSSADITFAAKVAQNTVFFADVVGITGPPIDQEVGGVALLNSFNSRLVRQNQIDLREAWVRTELFKQRFAVSAGRLDLTNYFDRNMVANDEFTQFLSDALVNNGALGLVVNGVGAVGVYDPKNGLLFKGGIQQSNLLTTNLSQSLFSLGEIDYVARPFSLPEGNYRFWGRYANASTNPLIDRPQAHGGAAGVSIDQKITDHFTVFGRYGYGRVDLGRMNFSSGGFQVQKRFVVNPGDTWAFGYAKSNIPTFGSQNLVEGYYNFRLSERLRLSFHLAHDVERLAGAKPVGYFVPGMRFQVAF